jgi:diguanylate cyclase (GGDEF)-like protein/PAS domain S-box-containing protein
MTAARDPRTKRALQAENQDLLSRLAEAEEVLRAIRAGQVDAILVAGEQGERVLTLGAMESAHRVLVEAMNEGAAVLEAAGTVLYCNGRLSAMLKMPLQRVMGSSLLRFIAPDDQDHVARSLRQGWSEVRLLDSAFCRGDGTTAPVQLSLSPVEIDGSRGICVVATDLTARNLARDALIDLSLRDELTGLSNRRGFLTLAQQQLTLARRLETEVVLVFLDLDGFKAINDTLGHEQGDRALADVAALLKNTYRESDIIARLGGDEFAILAAGTSDMSMDTLAARFGTNLNAFNRDAQRAYQLCISVGMVRCDHARPLPISDLLMLADQAMYEQKRLKHKTPMDSTR